MRYNTIITHENPDLDAIFCCYLLQQYGETRYPGVRSAQIHFYPAGRLPDGKNPDELETEGILAVDIGGGRLDTHPAGDQVESWKLTHSAASLLAADLGLFEHQEFARLLQFSRRQDSRGHSLSSKNPLDHLVALPNMIRGGGILLGRNYHDLVKLFAQTLHAIITAESHPHQQPYLHAFRLPWKCCLQKDSILIPDPPDLIALFAAYLLRRLGDERTAHLPIRVCAPHQGQAGWCKTGEVALFLGIDHRPEIGKMVAFADAMSPANSFLLDSCDPLDCTVSLPYILQGAQLLYRHEPSKIVDLSFRLFDCILAYEKEWFQAIEEYHQKYRLFNTGRFKMIAIKAAHGAVVKVARWKEKPDMILFLQEGLNNVSITLNKLGKLRGRSLKKLAVRLRIAEALTRAEEMDLATLESPGEFQHWFLHQSEQLLVHGSPKAARPPSALSFETMTQLTLGEIDWQLKIPEPYCPADHCRYHECPFFSFRLPNCFSHRKRCYQMQNS